MKKDIELAQAAQPASPSLQRYHDIVLGLWPAYSLFCLYTYYDLRHGMRAGETYALIETIFFLYIAYKTTMTVTRPNVSKSIFMIALSAILATGTYLLYCYYPFANVASLMAFSVCSTMAICATAMFGLNWLVLHRSVQTSPTRKALLVALGTLCWSLLTGALLATEVIANISVAVFTFIALYPMTAIMEKMKADRLPQKHEEATRLEE